LSVCGNQFNDKGGLWTKSANYHSRTLRYNAVYRADLIRKASKWAEWLEARFVTLDVTRVRIRFVTAFPDESCVNSSDSI